MPTLDNYSLSNYGLGGPGSKILTGTVNSSSDQIYFTNSQGNSLMNYYVEIPNIGIEPKHVIIKSATEPSYIRSTEIDLEFDKRSNGEIIFRAGEGEWVLVGNAVVSSALIRLPLRSGAVNGQYKYKVYG